MLETIDVEKPEGVECILGQGNFSIFTVENLAVLLKTCSPTIKFGVAMNEAKPRLTRHEGNDEELARLAAETCKKIGAGHAFVVMMKDSFPVNVLNAIKNHVGVCNIFGASENPIQVIVAKTNLGSAILGVVDGTASENIESEEQKRERKELLKKIGY